MLTHLRTRLLLLAGAAATGTLIVVLVPGLQFAYRRPAAHVASETAAALIGLLAAYLAFGRFRRDRRLDELLLVTAFVALATANLLFAAVPALLSDNVSPALVWAAVFGRCTGAVLLAAAAFVPRRRMSPVPPAELGVVVGLLSVAVVAVAVVALSSALPDVVTVAGSADDAGRPRLDGHPLVTAIQVVVAGVFAVASAGFARRATRGGDELSAWLALACVCAAFSRVNYALYPSLYTDLVYTGDAFRLAFYALVLVGAAREISSYWSSVAESRRLRERRRLARDLHDGLAQEIAFIARNAAVLARREDPERAERVRAAAERARGELQLVASALDDTREEGVAEQLARIAREVGEREQLDVGLALGDGVELDSDTRAELARILREAVTNAARHSHASRVDVTLSGGEGGIVLEVADGGCGFDPEIAHDGFGLVSMRERAEALGATLQISSVAGAGTRVRVEL